MKIVALPDAPASFADDDVMISALFDQSRTPRAGAVMVQLGRARWALAADDALVLAGALLEAAQLVRTGPAPGIVMAQPDDEARTVASVIDYNARARRL